jgi:hypothetical protein
MAAANADSLGLPVKVSSVHEAVLLLGVDRLRDWATLMLVSDLDDPGTHQLSAAITRARMCQNIAGRMDLPPEAAFTVGLVSAVAELLGQGAAELAPRARHRAARRARLPARRRRRPQGRPRGRPRRRPARRAALDERLARGQRG